MVALRRTHSSGGNGGLRRSSGVANRTLLIAGVVILVVVAFGGGYLLAHSKSQGAASEIPTAISPSENPTTSTPTGSTGPTVSPSPEDTSHLGDGNYFVFAKRVRGGSAGSGELRLTFDLAYLLNGEAANQAAAAHGYETPVPNDYFLVNDNPMLRTYPLSSDATVKYIPTDAEDQAILRTGNLAAWIEAIDGLNMTDYRGGDAGWWITIQGGAITAIRQQFFP
jgi:hypothetical protein